MVNKVFTRGRTTVDFILYEESTPNGETREVADIPNDLTKVENLNIGSLVGANGIPVTFKTAASVKASAVAGISLCSVSPVTGLTRQYNDVQIAYLKPASPRYPVEIADFVVSDAVEWATDNSLYDALANAADDASKKAALQTLNDVQDAIKNLCGQLWSVIPCGR